MFKVHFTNFGYYSANERETLEEAKKVARKAGFQSTIHDPSGEQVASFCPIAGLRDKLNSG